MFFFFFLFYKFLFCHHAFHLILKNKKSSTYRKYVEDDKFTVVPPHVGCKSIPLYSGTKYIPYPCNGGTGCLLKIIVQHTSRKPIPYIAPHRAPTYPKLSVTSPIYVLFLLKRFHLFNFYIQKGSTHPIERTGTPVVPP